MSILDTNKIDLIGTDKSSGEIILTISDHLAWENNIEHLEALQEKLNTYIQFIEGGEIVNKYPESEGKRLVIEIISKYEYNQSGLNFLEKVKPILNSIGVAIKQKTLKNKTTG